MEQLLRESKTEVLQYFELGRESAGKNVEAKTIHLFCGSALEKVGFSAFAVSLTSNLDCRGSAVRQAAV
nr:ADM_HP1_G0004740.mRNA.1.CDS.1 [Saccharomyces cerevisiae]